MQYWRLCCGMIPGRTWNVTNRSIKSLPDERRNIACKQWTQATPSTYNVENGTEGKAICVHASKIYAYRIHFSILFGIICDCVLAGECKEMELPSRSQETRKFYQKLNTSRFGLMQGAEMYWNKSGRIRLLNLIIK